MQGGTHGPEPPGGPVVLRDPGFGELADRAVALAASGRRRLLGIAGPPGAGKSTLAALLAEALGDRAVVVPMDGFHLPNEELERLALRDRKGAPETFDGRGYLDLLGRLRRQEGEPVRAPRFDRHLDRALPGAITVSPGVPLVITEGNYLLLDSPPWAGIRALLDEAWYLASDGARVDRLVRRHVAHGRPPAEARAWVVRSDEANARLVEGSRHRADVVVLGLPRG